MHISEGFKIKHDYTKHKMVLLCSNSCTVSMAYNLWTIKNKLKKAEYWSLIGSVNLYHKTCLSGTGYVAISFQLFCYQFLVIMAPLNQTLPSCTTETICCDGGYTLWINSSCLYLSALYSLIDVRISWCRLVHVS